MRAGDYVTETCCGESSEIGQAHRGAPSQSIGSSRPDCHWCCCLIHLVPQPDRQRGGAGGIGLRGCRAWCRDDHVRGPLGRADIGQGWRRDAAGYGLHEPRCARQVSPRGHRRLPREEFLAADGGDNRIWQATRRIPDGAAGSAQCQLALRFPGEPAVRSRRRLPLGPGLRGPLRDKRLRGGLRTGTRRRLAPLGRRQQGGNRSRQRPHHHVQPPRRHCGPYGRRDSRRSGPGRGGQHRMVDGMPPALRDHSQRPPHEPAEVGPDARPACGRQWIRGDAELPARIRLPLPGDNQLGAAAEPRSRRRP